MSLFYVALVMINYHFKKGDQYEKIITTKTRVKRNKKIILTIQKKD